jgi:hypothetical protein
MADAMTLTVEKARVEDGANSHMFEKRIMVGNKCIAFADEPEASAIAEALNRREGEDGALVDALKSVLAALVATTGLIARAEDEKVKPSRAVASTKMFRQMLKDYEKAVFVARATLARASLSRTEVQGVVPEGWKLVPVEPTEAMVAEAGGPVVDLYRCDDQSYRPADVYADMLAAAPPPPAPSTDAREGEDDPDSPQERLALVEGMLRIIMDNPGQAKLYARVALDFIEFTQAERLEMRGEAALASGGRGDE